MSETTHEIFCQPTKLISFIFLGSTWYFLRTLRYKTVQTKSPCFEFWREEKSKLDRPSLFLGGILHKSKKKYFTNKNSIYPLNMPLSTNIMTAATREKASSTKKTLAASIAAVAVLHLRVVIECHTL